MAYVEGTNSSELINAADGVTGGADEIYGKGGNDTIYGLGGADYIDGGVGADTMIGGTGSDIYWVDNPGDLVTEGRPEGSDDLVYASIDYLLPANVEHLNLIDGSGEIGGSGNGLANTIGGNESGNILKGLGGEDTLIGGGGNDTLNGGIGDDLLEGGTGADKMIGGLGNDVFYVDNPLDIVTENLGEGSEDTVKSYIEGYSLGANVENLRVVTAVSGAGNDLDNEIYGNAL